jgi:hypothetical protein
MKIDSKEFRVKAGDNVKLSQWPTSVKPVYKSKEEYQELLGEHVEALRFEFGRRKNNDSASSSASTSPTITGSSASRTSTRESIGINTQTLMRIA